MTKKQHLSGYCLFYVAIVLFAAGNSVWAETVSREAQKYMNRGMAAAEIAKSPTGYEEAIREFEQAVSLAPDWPAPYFNLGCVQKEVGKYQEALDNYRKYLELVPNAPDAEQVQTELDQIEYKLEKASEAAKIRSWLEGEWIGSSGGMYAMKAWPFRFVVNGDSVNAYLPTNYNMDITRLVDYETISVKQEDRKIQFSVMLKTVARERGSLSLVERRNVQYNLILTAPDKMEGTAVFTSKHYNSDGSIWRNGNGTKKTSFNKMKHSDHSMSWQLRIPGTQYCCEFRGSNSGDGNSGDTILVRPGKVV